MTTSRLDHASPWVLDTRSLGRRPGSMKPVALTLDVTGEPIGLEVVRVPVGTEVVVDLRMESVSEGVLLSGVVSAAAVGECSRCLTPISLDVDADIRELYAYPESTTAATSDEEEVPRLQDELIDLRPLVTEEIVLALPLIPLCREDCAGLCPDCGERFEDLEPGHRHEMIDPRWAALAGRLDEDDTNTEEK